MTTSSQKDIINDILSAMQCYPENEAFIIDDKHYTYAQLGEITASITHSLSEIKDEKIGIVAENRIETYAAILAVLAGGKTYVILHPAYPEERNLKIAALAGLRTCSVQVTLTGQHSAPDTSESSIRTGYREKHSQNNSLIHRTKKGTLISFLHREAQASPKECPSHGLT